MGIIKNKNKDKIQKEALEEALKEGNTLLTLATGAGKSKIAIDYCNKTNPKKIGLLVPTETLRDDNWREEFEKWSAQKDVWDNCVDRFCYASASKIKGNHYDVIICDEGHCLTELSSEFLQDNTYDKIIVLTATPPTKLEKIDIFKRLNFRNHYDLPLDEAIRLGVVAPYKIVVVKTRLNDTYRYIEAGSKQKPFKNTEKKQYEYYTKEIDRLSSSSENLDGIMVTRYRTPANIGRYKMLLRKRMHLIYNLKSKEFAASKILSTIPESERFLIFAGSIEQAENLCKNTYHSKTNDVDLKKFQNEEINRLSCVEALNMGINIPNVDGSIMVQVKSSEISMIQKIGRNIRFREGHEAVIYVIVTEGTQDEVWFNKAVQSLDESNFEYRRLEDFL